MNKKNSGSYYTPIRLANFIADYCLENFDQNNISILEPSVGDGNFAAAISNNIQLNRFQNTTLTIVERELDELNKAIDRCNPQVNLNSIPSDYLDFHNSDDNFYSLIIGNPPYIKSTLLSDEQKHLCKSIHIDSGLKDKKINNIWTAFLVSAIQKIENNGVIAFVLPLELLQVKFSEEIRDLLKSSFERLEVFMFDELQFQECKGQDTVLIVGYNQHQVQGTYYTTVGSIEELENRSFTLMQNISVSESNTKWTHHFLSPDEHHFLENLKSKLDLTTHYVDNKAGIVTAANDYFIVNDEVVTKNRLRFYSKPIVQKGFYVNGSVTFEDEDFNKLVEDDKPAYLLDFNRANPDKLSKSVLCYLDIGTERKLETRFKCRQRKHWYQVPNIAKQSEAFFFKRAHEYPKLLKNNAEAYVTDSAYMVESKEGYNIENIIFSFYNSLTLAFAELEGRYYGGGVLEITPNEFRSLPLPYEVVQDFEQYRNDFKNKKSIEDILVKYNFKILNSALGLNIEEIERIEAIRKKLVAKRMKK
ncbi:N-6 DNA methylase [Subsaximicrobium wynnwilliamsii]|uniref:site-specific DNA-methyltransferase (adenine-specific) n=1 Tax=Subsaximicrobium wynnwilliamsii TaxID=291179 RepID=A0A5C6ZEN0_9FLAO|nr:N-6 DNA methylase [Subsaximicrobium wynnwilliamsii]TXD81526.1 N-6 DNA methylase [Subsaximicrobium wynnwilliamsii]TXD87192.1 N-6 DNA methylase [Subsaximicrobium wynnwilliamsii]TXE00886.1 N-6 DNA methylase [Subsaximicrobium wynnwilliamsii]